MSQLSFRKSGVIEQKVEKETKTSENSWWNDKVELPEKDNKTTNKTKMQIQVKQ